MPKTETRKPRVLSVDLTGVEGRKGARRVPEGDYLWKIKDYAVGGDDEKQWLRIEFNIEKGPTDGTFSDLFSLSKKALWRLRLFLEAVGFKNLKDGLNKIPLDKLPGKSVAGTVADDEYEGKIRSKVQDYFSAKDYENLGAAGADDEEEGEEEDEDDEDVEDAVTSGDGDEDEEELEIVDDDDI